jgi:hypothetical protein
MKIPRLHIEHGDGVERFRNTSAYFTSDPPLGAVSHVCHNTSPLTPVTSQSRSVASGHCVPSDVVSREDGRRGWGRELYPIGA